jgi:hypothetical protein
MGNEAEDGTLKCQRRSYCMMGPVWREEVCARSGIDTSKCPTGKMQRSLHELEEASSASGEKKQGYQSIFYIPRDKK